MRGLKIFVISFVIVFVFVVFGALSFSSISRSRATVFNFDKGATIFVPVYEITMEEIPVVVSSVDRNADRCMDDWMEPVDSKCCV